MDKRIVLAREDLKKTNYWMITLMISALTLIILSLTNVLTINSNNEHYIDFVHGYQTGLSFALFVFPCINLISNFFLAKNEVKLIEKYINDHDERKLFIADKVGGNFSFTFEIITMALVSVIAPLYSFDLLLGIVACIFIIIIIRGCLYLYYNHCCYIRTNRQQKVCRKCQGLFLSYNRNLMFFQRNSKHFYNFSFIFWKLI